jgi:hypothetical protein
MPSKSGLQLDAEQIGIAEESDCEYCQSTLGKKLSADALENLAHRFFVWGSLWHPKYGAAPLIQFNEHQKTSIDVSPWQKTMLKYLRKFWASVSFTMAHDFGCLEKSSHLKPFKKQKHVPR